MRTEVCFGVKNFSISNQLNNGRAISSRKASDDEIHNLECLSLRRQWPFTCHQSHAQQQFSVELVVRHEDF